MKKVALSFFTLAMITACSTLLLPPYDPVEFKVTGKTAVMIGVIDSDIEENLEDLLKDNPEITTLVMQNVEGSVDDEANLRAAHYIRKKGLNTHIPRNGLVASGGTDFFLAGVKRTAHPTARIGVHSWSDGEYTNAIELPHNHPEHTKYIDYYQSIGIPVPFYWFTLQAAPSNDMHWMTLKEQKRYKVTTHQKFAEWSKFAEWNNSLIEKIENNPSYKRIPIDTGKQIDQVMTLQYKAYKKEISKKQYIDNFLKMYPRHRESIEWHANQIEWLANQLPR